MNTKGLGCACFAFLIVTAAGAQVQVISASATQVQFLGSPLTLSVPMPHLYETFEAEVAGFSSFVCDTVQLNKFRFEAKGVKSLDGDDGGPHMHKVEIEALLYTHPGHDREVEITLVAMVDGKAYQLGRFKRFEAEQKKKTEQEIDILIPDAVFHSENAQLSVTIDVEID